MLSKERRLNRGQIKNLLKKGKTFNSQNLLAKVLQNNKEENSRFGFVVSGKVHKSAVKRNLLKRRIGYIINKHKSFLSGGWFCLFIVKKSVLSLSFTVLENQILFLLKGAKIYSKNQTN